MRRCVREGDRMVSSYLLNWLATVDADDGFMLKASRVQRATAAAAAAVRRWARKKRLERQAGKRAIYIRTRRARERERERLCFSESHRHTSLSATDKMHCRLVALARAFFE